MAAFSKTDASPTPKYMAEMLRVNHAGEYGAVRIYAGQQRFARSTRQRALVAEMAGHEQAHLSRFNQLLADRQVRPSLLLPLWHVAGYGLGAATALMGDAAAMACTEAVETVIEQHYNSQLASLRGRDDALAATIQQFKEEEVAHKDLARAEGAANAPAYPLLTGLIKLGSRLAIKLSEKL
ncbi:MAG: demethoxyubiquinone hydroxylase family protein [Alphaproteobacteria bacterium]|nr:demethoxyubiquinone hydroxylase family protein [Alphaproteobacteria bacterium]